MMDRTPVLDPPTHMDDAERSHTDRSVLDASDTFIHRHVGPDAIEVRQMLRVIGYESLDDLVEATIPDSIRMHRPLEIGAARSEHELLRELREIASQNQVFRSFIGMGYHGCITPPVIQRNILENPGWYTQYTPYQAEISQGRLEALLNFQTMVCDLTGLPVAGASLLDEGTAAAEAMTMCARITGREGAFIVSPDCHPQTIAVVQVRAKSQGFTVRIEDPPTAQFDEGVFGVLFQYPTTDGRIVDYRSAIERAHAAGAPVVMAADPLALTLLTPPGELGADIAVGSTQRFGVPMGGGGPHAAYLATREEHVRKMPGRLIGISKDAQGNHALRMAIQTREQHIKRDRATSNICTAQVLLAVMASMYAVYHGPDGLRRIATRVRSYALALREGLHRMGHDCGSHAIFDCVRVRPVGVAVAHVLESARASGMNLRDCGDGSVGISLDETTTREEIAGVLACFGSESSPASVDHLLDAAKSVLPENLERRSAFLTHPVFNTHHSETEMLRYMRTLESRDLSLAHSMIPLGSCTMKLNGTSEMLPVTWPEFAHIHPFAPQDQTKGYQALYEQLGTWLGEITGFTAVSLQPNAGSQGEYAGLLTIRAYHEDRGDRERNICLIPTSAHGTNPASAITAGMQVVPIRCDERGNIDVDDLRAKATQHAPHLAALMITYPSTHGVFETTIRAICDIVHEHGGLVYMDGANMNAQVGLCRPGDMGADVCHLNLHKTFCIPHGGGGPGMGPICVNDKLKPFLPTHPVQMPASAGERPIGPISAAPYGSPSILPISWVYIALMGDEGLTHASRISILNANYMAARLREHYNVLYTGPRGNVAHEFIIDCRPFDHSAGIKIDDIAKRLMDYGFHAPTMSWPVPGTLMIEPTESESKGELDRLCEALISIRAEIAEIERGEADRDDNVLTNAPHTTAMVTADDWSHPYSRERAAFPTPWLREHKFWPPVARIDNPYGDRNLMCTCLSVEESAGELG